MKYSHRMNQLEIKTTLENFSQSLSRVRLLPYIRLWWCWNAKRKKNIIFIHICVQYQFERISFFFQFVFALVLLLPVLCVLVSLFVSFIEFYRNIYIPCFVALQNMNIKNKLTNVYDVCSRMLERGGKKEAIASHVYRINWILFVCV